MFNGCVLTGGVGTGKTVTAMAYYYTKVLGGVINDWESVQNPIDIYVFTTARKRDDLDWELWGMRFGVTNDRKASHHGLQLTVDSYNNIGKYTKVHGAFIIFDEQRMVGAGAWSKAFIHLAKSNQWVMLSATPGDKWEDYIPLFVANGFFKNRSEFKRDHCVYSYYGKFPKLERYLGVNKLIKLKNSIIVDMPYERHTKRHIHDVIVDFDRDLFDMVVKKRWNPYEERPLRDVAELFLVMRKIVNSDLSRLEMLKCLMLTHPRLIVFYNFDYELEILRSAASFGQEIVNGTAVCPKPHISENTATSSTSRKGTNECLKTHLSTDILTDSFTSQPSGTQSGESSNTTGPQGISKRVRVEPSIKLPSSTPSQPGTRSATGQRHIPGSQSTRSSATANMTPSSSPTSTGNTSLLLDRPKKSGLEPHQRKTSQQSTGSHSSQSTRSDGRHIRKTTNRSELNSNDQNTDSSRSIGHGVNETLSSVKSFTKSIETSNGHPRSAPTRNVTEKSATISFAIAEWNGHKHEPVPDTDHWVYLVQYMAGAEAWDCITTDTIVFYSQTYSFKTFSQAQGRTDRLNTPYIDLQYYVFKSMSFIDKAIGKSLRNKEDFNEKKYGKVYD